MSDTLVTPIMMYDGRQRMLGPNQQLIVDTLKKMLKEGRKLPITFEELVNRVVADTDKPYIAIANSLNAVRMDRFITFNHQQEIIEFRPNGISAHRKTRR